MATLNREGKTVPYDLDYDQGHWFNTKTKRFISDNSASRMGLHHKITRQEVVHDLQIFLVVCLGGAGFFTLLERMN